MEQTKAVRAMLAASGRRPSDVSTQMGKSAGNLSNQLSRGKGLTVATVAAAADCCGYRLALIPESAAIQADSFAIDPPHN